MDFSLLWPANSMGGALGHDTLSDFTMQDLNLAEFCKRFTASSAQLQTVLESLSDLVYDEDTILYRQDIFEDFMKTPGLCDAFSDIAVQLRNLEYMNTNSRYQEEAKLWFLLNRFKELESYVNSIALLDTQLARFSVDSEGLKELKAYFHEIASDEEFISLSQIVKSIDLDMDEIHSLTLGVNLDSSLNPSEVTLVAVNQGVYKEHRFLGSVFGNLPTLKAVDLRTPTKLHRMADDRRDPLMYNLYKDIERLLDPIIGELSDKLGKFAHIKTAGILSLIPEIEFYLCGARLVRRMEDEGMPMCRASVRPRAERFCRIEGLYNIGLVFSMLEKGGDPRDIVPNRACFDENGRILIITGPNRGGKTVFTEAVGLAHLLFQAGLYVPALSAEMSPVDRIFTHFPVDENRTVELGRFGEEAKRIGDIFRGATAHSLILLNESLTSTSYTEGLYLAKCAIQAMRYLGLRAIYNTHIHEIAESVDEMNAAIDGGSRILSMVSQMRDGKRSYIIEPGKPLGTSYAMDIATKYGIDLPQLVSVIDEKKALEKQMNEFAKL